MKKLINFSIIAALFTIHTAGYSIGIQNRRDSTIGVWVHSYTPNINLGDASATTKPTNYGDNYTTNSRQIESGAYMPIRGFSSIPKGSHICIYAGGLIPEDYSHTTEIFRTVPGNLRYSMSNSGLWSFNFTQSGNRYQAQGWTAAKKLMEGKAYLSTAYCTRDINHIFIID